MGLFVFIKLVDVDNENGSAILNEEGLSLRSNGSEEIIQTIVLKTIKESFKQKILTVESFYFDSIANSFLLKAEKIPLKWAAIRNLLLECGFLTLQFINISSVLVVNPEYEYLLSDQIRNQRRTISLEDLKEQLLKQEEIGEEAEKFVLKYEKERLNFSENSKKVKQISGIDVTAGYDIISYNSEESITNDRFIEVKAISKNFGFYLSSNELETAKVLGPRYYLYLVNLAKVGISGYEPLIISDPVSYFKHTNNWIIEPQSFFVRKI